MQKPRKEIKNSLSGLTLVELLVSVAVTAIITGAIFLLLSVCVESWDYTSKRLLLQKSSSGLMNYLVDGGYDSDGIRDMVELKQAGANDITFVPLWIDSAHKFDKQTNPQQKFILSRQYKAGASVPMGQYRGIGETDFNTASVSFKYGPESALNKLDDELTFIDVLPNSADIKITFTPNADTDLSVQKIFHWDKDRKRVYETYNGATKDLIEHNSAARVEGLYFTYFDNLNQIVRPKAGGFISSAELKKISAVKIYLLIVQDGEWKELTSFINIRSAGATGVFIAAGTEFPLPAPDKIKAFSVGNLFGPKQNQDNQIQFIATPNRGTQWKITLWISKTATDVLMLTRYAIEYPPGRIVNSSFVNQRIATDEFINLMSLDRSGLYDYEKDVGVSGKLVRIEADKVTLNVTRCDFDGASLFVRP